MALSEEEERLLDQMEAALSAEDPKLVHTFSGKGTRRVHRRRAALAGVGFFVGLGLLVGGMAIGMNSHPYIGIGVSVAGFVIMVATAVTAIYAWQHVTGANSAPGRAQDHPKAQPSSTGGSGNGQNFMDKMEERWRKRRDESGS